ncbi:hypothetical protein FA13DRAFT_1733898 [Coprinellus micaceus]|uniref:Uncharacterized protein n=1 Tax=Coprinellus micaceus TaxID=71717 RepID=A0A4Y7T7D1_COPMI|nr:hypothetical protein FA13DRAFT_1733898 [Coprinellus micaceus]
MTTLPPMNNSGSKKNASSSTQLVQTTIIQTTTTTTAAKKGKGKKRILPLADGSGVDLLGELPFTPQVMEALRQRVIQLEDQLAASSPSSDERPAKRARTAAEPEASGSAPSTSTVKVDEKKKKVQVKKIFDRLKKECKADGVKFQGSPKTIKFDEVLEANEFEALFGGKGFLVQPRPDNKPKSTVTIMTFNASQVNSFFGGDMKGLKGNIWTRGGAPSFSKSVKIGPCDVTVESMEVNYSKNGMKCTLKFEVHGDGDDICYGGGYGKTYIYGAGMLF